MRTVFTIGATRYVTPSRAPESYMNETNIQNDIPVFCPALTDGSLGDMIYFHTYKTETQLSIDIVQDIRRLNDMSVKAKQAGMIILGGGVCKHQIANAMLFVSHSSSLVFGNSRH
jgi:deoxyhypusine synthase